MHSRCKRFTQKWLVSSTSTAWHQTTNRLVACSWRGLKWNLHASFSRMHLKLAWNYSWWKIVGRMPMVFTAKWLLHAIHLAAVFTECSTVIRATLLSKKSRHRQSFHGGTIENFHTRWVFFFPLPHPWNLLTLDICTSLLLALLLPRVVIIWAGRTLPPSTRRWERRLPRAIILLRYLRFSTDRFRFLLFGFWIAVWNFSAPQSRTEIWTITYGAAHRSIGSIWVCLFPRHICWGYENPSLNGQGPEAHQHDVNQLWWLQISWHSIHLSKTMYRLETQPGWSFEKKSTISQNSTVRSRLNGRSKFVTSSSNMSKRKTLVPCPVGWHRICP